MINFTPTRAAAIAAALTVFAPSIVLADYETGPTWHYQEGDRPGIVGERQYCVDGGYPRSTLVLDDVYADEVRALHAGPSDVLLVFDRGDEALLVRLYGERGEDCAVGALEIRFADGQVWNAHGHSQASNIPWAREAAPGTRRADRLRGSRGADALAGLAGDDRLYGYEGGDALWGGAGDDVLYGYEGDDVLVGDEGDDDLYGDDGDDVYLFDGAFGYDVIDDSSGDIWLSFRNVYSHDATLTRVGDALVITCAGREDRVKLRAYFGGDAAITRLAFADVLWEDAELDEHLPR